MTTPNYPNKYPKRTTCQWDIVAPSGTRIELQFLNFSMESYDKLYIYDGPSSSSSLIEGPHINGSSKISSGNRLHAKWTSDGSVERSGFNISIRNFYCKCY